jgi:hypothetical protein
LTIFTPRVVLTVCYRFWFGAKQMSSITGMNPPLWLAANWVCFYVPGAGQSGGGLLLQWCWPAEYDFDYKANVHVAIHGPTEL